jgi:hypothetical protein
MEGNFDQINHQKEMIILVSLPRFAALALGLSLSFLAPIGLWAQGQPFNCDYNAYLFQFNDVYAVDLASGNSYPIATDVTPGNINGAAYNPADGYIWGALSNPDRAIVRIGRDFSTTIYTIPQLPSANPYVGAISQTGVYYLKAGGSSFHTIDLNPNSDDYLKYLTGGSLSQSINIHDWAFNAVDNQLYTVEKGTNQLIRINPTSGAVAKLGEVPVLAGLNYTYGAVYFDAAGNFYVSANQTGTIYVIYAAQSATGGNMESNIFAFGPSSSSNDGARCPTAPVPQENCSNGRDDDGDGLVDCDDPACSGVSSCPEVSASSAKNGGLESNNRLSGAINRRNYLRTRTSFSFAAEDQPTMVQKNDLREKNSEIKLIDFLPLETLAFARPVESSPIDLLDITNAEEVLSVDFMEDGLRVGAVLALKTSDGVYEHTKFICDRLGGGQLLSVSTINIAGHDLIRSIVQNPDGSIEFVVGLSAALEGDGFRVESHWNLDRYSPGATFYNFQIWALSLDNLARLTEEVVRRLASKRPIYGFECSPPPTVFVKKARYERGEMVLDVINTDGTETIKVSGGIKRTETGLVEPFAATSALRGGLQTVKIPTGGLFDVGFRLESESGVTPDDLYVSEGAWGYDAGAAGSLVKNFAVNEDLIGAEGDRFAVEREVYLEGGTAEYISVYRALNAKFSAVDLSSFNELAFTASGNGLLEVTVVSAGVQNWEDQARATVALRSEPRIIKLRDYQLTKGGGQPADFSAVKMLVFSMKSASGEYEAKQLHLKNVSFGSDGQAHVPAFGEGQRSFIYPNPARDRATLNFATTQAGSFSFRVYSISGQEVGRQSGIANSGINQVTVSLPEVPGGTYYYSLTTPDGTTDHGKITIVGQ